MSTDRRREQQLAGLASDRLLGPLSRSSGSGADQSATTVLIAFGANLLVAIAKTVAAALTSSASLVAEAAHSWADTGNEIFLLVAGRRARRPPDRAHPLGHGREAYVWSLLAAIGLFVAGAAVSVTHGVQELRNPEPASDFVVGYVVLAFSFVVGRMTHWRRPKTLASQIEALGVKPADIKYLAVSHTHPDHIGNVELFAQAMLLVQKAEYQWPSPLGVGRFKPEHPVTKLEGDYDIFGDGSVTIIATPGHTPGHQSLLVKLPKTGALVLSGDAVHFKSNWENRGVPSGNTDKDKTLASMQRIADVLAKEKAQLWINHDKAQRDNLKMAPDFYD